MKENIEEFIKILDRFDGSQIDFEKMKCLIDHGHKCMAQTNFLKECHKNVTSLDFEIPPREEILLQTWDKQYYSDQWSDEVAKLECSRIVSVDECQKAAECGDRDGIIGR